MQNEAIIDLAYPTYEVWICRQDELDFEFEFAEDCFSLDEAIAAKVEYQKMGVDAIIKNKG